MLSPNFLLPAFVLCLGLLVTQTAATAQESEEFRPLFNGKDLSGWVLVNTPSETWSIEDGMLICSGVPTGEIRTDRMYQNFVLELEWRHLVKAGNAGIFVWADDITARGVPFHRSVEVQVLENSYGQGAGHTTHGDIFPIHGAKMTPINGRGGSRAFPTEERSNPAPEWNHYRIECNDGQISLAVNGKVVTRGKDASPRKGYICIESEGGTVQYRNIRIKELPETPVAPEDVATAHRGFRSIYSGIDLRGWKSPQSSSSWQSRDWTLRHDGKASTPGSNALIFDEPLTGDVEFILDVRPAEGFKSFGLEGAPHLISTKPDAIAKPITGEWSRIEGRIQEGMLSISVNGTPSSRQTAVSSPWTLTLSPDGAADFANIYVRPLTATP